MYLWFFDILFLPLTRLQRLEHLYAKFDHKAANIEKWAAGKDALLTRNDDIEAAGLPEATALEKIHTTFESDIVGENQRIEQLQSIAQELKDLKYHNCDSVDTRLQSIRDLFSNLQQLSDDRRERIKAHVETQQMLDNLRLQFAKDAAVSDSLQISQTVLLFLFCS